jgi:hypothetical protein
VEPVGSQYRRFGPSGRGKNGKKAEKVEKYVERGFLAFRYRKNSARAEETLFAASESNLRDKEQASRREASCCVCTYSVQTTGV